MKGGKRTGGEKERKRSWEFHKTLPGPESAPLARCLPEGQATEQMAQVSTTVLFATKRKQNPGGSVLSPVAGLWRSELTSTVLSRQVSLNDPSLSLTRKLEPSP